MVTKLSKQKKKFFQLSLQDALDSVYPNKFLVDRHPNEFGDIYSTYPLPKDVQDKIYNVDVSEKKPNGRPKYEWGITMDFSIRNLENDKILFGEIKRQDGWIETRICKLEEEMLMSVVVNTLLQVLCEFYERKVNFLKKYFHFGL